MNRWKTQHNLRWVVIYSLLEGACESIPLDEEGQRLATQSLMWEHYRKPPHREALIRMLEEEFGD